MSLRVFLLINIIGEIANSNSNIEEWQWYNNGRNIEVEELDEGPCTIEIVNSSQLTQKEFIKRYAYHLPVIINHNLNNDNKFHELCSRDKLLSAYGDKVVRLSTANTYSYAKYDVPFRTYVEEMMKPQSLTSLGNETYYYFGDNNHAEWKPLFDLYQFPPYHLPGKSPALSFGVAASGTGVPFHFHGPGFAEVVYGRKRWFLYAPDQQPQFDPDKSTLHWTVNELPALAGSDVPLQCTITPGQLIYFPDHWWHATLNLDTSVFVSTFLG